ncbi:hypothetical protein ACRALDRAFT_2139917 [Sodiomyces alcalophilus JCM 7366]|uniref:uncharacterized protein n=1 Tax=Sodiomyces alcalophilus JCM 7366 TaxID=591952 RepID=UPI0039B43D8A
MDERPPRQFDYTSAPLPSASTHIRLLKIGPSRLTAKGSGSDHDHYSSRIVCEMTTTDIRNPAPYKCLSYAWGPEDRKHWLEITGTWFPIIESLDSAIRHLRHKDETITIWIDQICIHQDDSVEKGLQVRLMGDVYRKAEQTLAWLGPAADGSDDLMDCWADIGGTAQRLGLSSYFTKEKLPLLFAKVHNQDPDDELTRDIQTLLERSRPVFESVLEAMVAWDKRPWFSRVWIVQEVSLCANSVLACGHKVVPADDVALAGFIFDSAMTTAVSHTDLAHAELIAAAQNRRTVAILGTRRRRQRLHRGESEGDKLFNLVRKLFVEHDTEATLARDRIYGLLGIAADADQLGIVPDYTAESSMPTLRDAARAMIRNGRVELLSFSQFPKAPFPGEDRQMHLPTWAPDWRPGLARSFYTIYEYAEDHLFAASGTTSVDLRPTLDPDVLGLGGYLVDTIEETGTTWHAEGGYSTYSLFLEEIKNFCEASATKNNPIYADEARRSEAHWRIPVGDMFWMTETDTRRAHSPAVRDAYDDCVALLAFTLGSESFTQEQYERHMAEYDRRRQPASKYRTNMGVMTGKKPFLTRKGYVGTASGEANVGDAVVVFCGGRIPHVLRAVREGKKYSYVGEAYCDGVMDGEILSLVEKEVFDII